MPAFQRKTMQMPMEWLKREIARRKTKRQQCHDVARLCSETIKQSHDHKKDYEFRHQLMKI